MRKWEHSGAWHGLGQRWQVGHGLFLPQPSQDADVTLPIPSVPNPGCVSLASRKAQHRIADRIFHHRIVAAQGLEAFREGGSSNLHEGQGFSSHPSFPHRSSLPRRLTAHVPPQSSSSPPFILLLCLTSGLLALCLSSILPCYSSQRSSAHWNFPEALAGSESSSS